MVLTKANQCRSFKPVKKHKQNKKKKVKTPRPEGEHVCYACGRTKYLEIHHVYPGPNRDNSSKYGAVVWLCHHHHRGQPDGVHGGNEQLDKELKRKFQIKLMEEGLTMEEFVKTFGRSYCI